MEPVLWRSFSLKPERSVGKEIGRGDGKGCPSRRKGVGTRRVLAVYS